MKRILLIDDDIDDRIVFQMALKGLEAEIKYIEALDGQEGLELLAKPGFAPPDMIFVDLNMPRVTGLEFVVKMKQMPGYENVPTYIYTTSTSPTQRVNCLTAGASGYIIKHVKPSELAKELRVLLEKAPIEPDLFSGSNK